MGVIFDPHSVAGVYKRREGYRPDGSATTIYSFGEAWETHCGLPFVTNVSERTMPEAPSAKR